MQDNIPIKLTVESLKTRLDKYLAEHIHISRNKIQRDIEAGLIQVNGEVINVPKTRSAFQRCVNLPAALRSKKNL